MDEEIRQALTEVREMKRMCGNINMKLTNIVTQRGQDFKKKLEAEYQRGFEDGKKEAESSEAIEQVKADAFNKGMLFKEEKIHDAFLRGIEKGKAVKGCEGCKYEGRTARQSPCFSCARNNANDYWTAKDDKIKVRDEVVWTEDENVVIVVTSIYTADSMEWCDGVCRDGKVYSILTEHARKTGRHFDIDKILEEIAT